jgi:hypothetical protein
LRGSRRGGHRGREGRRRRLVRRSRGQRRRSAVFARFVSLRVRWTVPVGVRRRGSRAARRGRGRCRRRCRRPGPRRPNSTGLPSRLFAIGRASGSCRLTRRVAPLGVTPGDPLPGLRGDLPGSVEQFGEVVDGPVEPPAPTPSRRVVAAAAFRSAAIFRPVRRARFALANSRTASSAAVSARSASSPFLRRTTSNASSRAAALHTLRLFRSK